MKLKIFVLDIPIKRLQSVLPIFCSQFPEGTFLSSTTVLGVKQNKSFEEVVVTELNMLTHEQIYLLATSSQEHMEWLCNFPDFIVYVFSEQEVIVNEKAIYRWKKILLNADDHTLSRILEFAVRN